MSASLHRFFNRTDKALQKTPEEPAMSGSRELPGSVPSIRRTVTEGRLPREYALVRTVWTSDTRDEAGEGTKSEVGLFRDAAGDRHYLYYSVYAYSTYFTAGAVPGRRYYFEITDEESRFDDATLRNLALEAWR